MTEGAYSPTARMTLMASSPRSPASATGIGDLALECLEVGVVDGDLGRLRGRLSGGKVARPLHQIRMKAAQVDRRDRSDRVQRGDAAGEPMRGHADAHASLNDRQQGLAAQSQGTQPARIEQAH